MKQYILDVLKNTDTYTSGSKLSQRLGMTRSGVWKHIGELRNEGYVIDSVPNRGYKLISVPDKVNEFEIKYGLKTTLFGQNVCYVEETDSTNNEAKRRSDMPDGTVFAAQTQTGGKGRLGRAWSSPNGGVWMSILMKPEILPAEAAQITLIAGLSVCRALKKYDAAIKWPNDIVIGTKKLCGILTEMSAETDRVNYIVCGIGINVNTETFPDEISKKAVSLYMLDNIKHSRAEIIRWVLEEFEPLYFEYLKNGMGKIVPEYKKHCVNLGKTVTASSRGADITGIAADVTPEGGLLIKTKAGETVVTSGEVSVKGFY